MPALTIGLLSDLHHEPEPPRQRSWINDFDPAGLTARIAEALRWFAEEGAALVVVAGDLAELPRERAYDEVLAALTAGGLPVVAVGGNHDWEPDGLLATKAQQHGVALLGEAEPDGVPLAAVTAAPVGDCPGPFAAAAGPAGAGPRVVVSHFPLLGEAERLAAAGLPYAGDLVDRAEVEQALREEGVPLLVLAGHIHARCSQAAGPILQLACGSLIEPPHDAAVVRIDADLGAVERTVRRLGPAAAIEPVFAPERERWERHGGEWRAAP